MTTLNSNRDKIFQLYLYTNLPAADMAIIFGVTRCSLIGWCARKFDGRKKAREVNGVTDAQIKPCALPPAKPQRVKAEPKRRYKKRSEDKKPPSRAMKVAKAAKVSKKAKECDTGDYSEPKLFNDDGLCKYAVGEHAPYRWCKNRATHGSWCGQHAKKVFRKVTGCIWEN